MRFIFSKGRRMEFFPARSRPQSGRAEFLCKNYGEAIVPLSRYLDQHADDDTVRSELGLSFFQIGRYEEVVRVLDPIKSAIAANPELARAYTTSMAKLDRK